MRLYYVRLVLVWDKIAHFFLISCIHVELVMVDPRLEEYILDTWYCVFLMFFFLSK